MLMRTDERTHQQEGLGTGRAVSLLVAAVTLSVAAALLVSGGSDPVPVPEPAAADPAPTAPSTDQVNPLAAGQDVLPELVPKSSLAPAPADEINVAVAPEMPPAADRTTPAIVDVSFEVVENVSTIDPGAGTQTETWGYRLTDGPETLVVGTPGPVIRARVGDVLRFTIHNPAGNEHPHNVDFHAVTGQGGGAADTTVAPGETRTIEARLLYPGFFMYHCAYGDVPSHISHGMYGGILVDPATPLPEVHREWYVVQSEYYLADSDADVKPLDRAALTDELPTHVVFNGAVGAIAGDNALEMEVGERARIYFINAGLNLLSSFHPIGSHWDVVYQEAALLNDPIRGSQTTLVPAGGGTVVELVGQVPQTIVLVDHALTRTFDKGAAGHIVITGAEDPEIFEQVEPGEITRPEEAQAPDSGGDEAAGDGPTAQVSILQGSMEFQEEGADDEFALDESPADYSTNVLEVEVGTTVTWTNHDHGIMHSVTAVDGSFDSGLLGDHETFSYTFTEPGEYEYLCSPHPWMRAKVVVTG
ncbi:MAG: plastocyanin/azurin family copper-binding protein [Nitriliruptorales bacterium]|nr:plastocyanin/azurin family copper-binding protein [Nitriliruptorales bacterium]